MRVQGSKLIFVGIAVLWGAYVVFGPMLSRLLAGTFGDLVGEKTRGLIPDPERFFLVSLQETALLATAILVVALLLRVASAAMKGRGHAAPGRYVALAVLCFVCLNGLFVVAGTTTIFWISGYLAYPNYKQAFFNTNKILLAKSTAATRVVIAGSSQGHSQFDAGLLNESFYPDAQFVNLSYAGSSAWDLRLTLAQYERLRPDYVVTYISIMNFYDINPGASRIIPLVTWSSLSDVFQYRDDGYIEREDVLHATLSLIFPAFQMRRSLELSVFGPLAEKGFARPRIARIAPIARRSGASRYADRYEVGNGSEYQKSAFCVFLDRNIDLGVRPVIVVGQVHPALERAVDPAIMEDYGRFIVELERRYPETVIFIKRNELRHEIADYDDYMHIDNDERTHFTQRFSDLISELIVHE